MTFTAQDIARVASGLTKAQREVLFRYEPTLEKQAISADDFFHGPRLCVEMRPPEYEDGCLIDPGDRIWFAGASASSSAGISEWDECFIQYNETGLAVRQYLMEQNHAGPTTPRNADREDVR